MSLVRASRFICNSTCEYFLNTFASACRGKRVTLLLDGDEVGKKAAEEIAGRLVHKMFVWIIELPENKHPDMLSPEELRKLLN